MLLRTILLLVAVVSFTPTVSRADDPVPTGTLVNIASRVEVGAGDQAAIAGFIVVGPDNSTKRVLIRGLGPSLTAAGIIGTLQNPTLELHPSTGAIVTNDNWMQSQQAEIQATGIAPSNPAEAAIIATLPVGAHTVVFRGQNNGTGVGLLEVYDLDGNSVSYLGNISTRGQVKTGDRVLIGGFIVSGEPAATVLIRALGPSLPVSGALGDPMLELHDANGTLVSNDSWRLGDEEEIMNRGLAPTNDAEAALISTVAPGNYTVIVRGKNNSSGVALIEAYNLQ